MPDKYHENIKKQYQHAVNQEKYENARAELGQLKVDLQSLNMAAARSLDEAMEEILTLHKLGINELFARSFATTNCIENLNSQLRKYVGKVKNWTLSNERYRWVAAALLEIEHKMRKVDNFVKLDVMKNALIKEVKRRTLANQISTK